MDKALAATLATGLADRSKSLAVSDLRGTAVVPKVLATSVPDDAKGAIAVDENGDPFIVAVSGDRAVVLRPQGASTDDFSMVGERLRFDHPDTEACVEYVTIVGNFSPDNLYTQRIWTYRLGGAGPTLRLEFNQNSSPDDEALEKALAAAAGWPT